MADKIEILAGKEIRFKDMGDGTYAMVTVGADYDSAAGAGKVSMTTALAGEDTTQDVLKTEERFSYATGLTDFQVKNAAGFLHSITFSCNDAAPTAGTIDVYDNTAGSGTKIFSWSVPATTFAPFTLLLDEIFATGLYIDFTTTNDVFVNVSYR